MKTTAMNRAGKASGASNIGAQLQRSLCLLLLVLPVFSGWVGAATITVQTDRNPAVLQESFRLIFEASGDVDGDPDFTPLDKDFQVLSTSTSTSMSIVNTRITRTKQWQLTLMPRTAGNLIIPAIAFGKDESPQTSLTVIQAGAGAAGQDAPDIFMEVEAVPASVYVQSQVIYTLKLYRAVATSNDTLSEPVFSRGSAIIELLDAGRSYDTFVEGRRYRVFQRSFAIYPQVSGNLLIEPLRFQGQLAPASQFSLDPFGAGARTVVRQSEAVELQVKPVPTTYQARHWLPATDVKITEKWSKNPLELLSNEPATRTLTLTAQGLTGSQLPELRDLLPDSFRQYPDQPALDNWRTAGGITGVRVQKNAIIPGQPGEYMLPELSLPWWNTATQTLEYAVLPERRVQVAAAAPDAALDMPELPATDIGAQVPGQAAPESQTSGADATDASPGISTWQWLAGILAIGWLVTVGYFLKDRRRARAASPQPHTEHLRTARRAFKQACRDNDPQQAKTALLNWARVRPDGPPAASLGELERQSGGRLATEIRVLSRRLYSRDAEETWRGDALWQAFLEEEKSTVAKTAPERGKLEPLFRL